MRWPIRNQILIPFAGLLAIAITTIAVAAAWFATARSERETLARLRRVVGTLGAAHFPFSSNVLEKMKGLSGADFVAVDASGQIVASTLPEVRPQELARIMPGARDVESLVDYPSVRIMDNQYYAALLPARQSTNVRSLFVLYSEQRWQATHREAAWPPLAIGALTLLLMIPVSAWLARRLGHRIRTVQELFARIADGDFGHADTDWPHDELHELVVSANRLSDQLREMQHTIRHTERMRLLAQLAGGLAHQLRNAVTGARMAVQLHQKRCQRDRTVKDESLQVALRQLSLTEEQVKGLLALGRQQPLSAMQGNLCDLLREVEQLLMPTCSHAHVQWECHIPPDADQVLIEDFERVRSALLNLALNGIEAARTGGRICVQASVHEHRVWIEVCDSGPGPSAEIRESLFEPFVTSKPEGVGLGLALARQLAEMQGGSLDWCRRDGQTVFRLSLPVKRLPSPACGRGAGGEGVHSQELAMPSPLTPLPQSGRGEPENITNLTRHDLTTTNLTPDT